MDHALVVVVVMIYVFPTNANLILLLIITLLLPTEQQTKKSKLVHTTLMEELKEFKVLDYEVFHVIFN